MNNEQSLQIIPLSNASSKPLTMVIKANNAVIAHIAMNHSLSPIKVANLAVPQKWNDPVLRDRILRLNIQLLPERDHFYYSRVLQTGLEEWQVCQGEQGNADHRVQETVKFGKIVLGEWRERSTWKELRTRKEIDTMFIREKVISRK